MDSPPGASSRLARGMSTAWEGDEPRSTGWTRREWAKLALAAGAASSVLAMGGAVAGQFLPPPAKFQGELRQEIYYTKMAPSNLVGRPPGTADPRNRFPGVAGRVGGLAGALRKRTMGPGNRIGGPRHSS